MIWRNQILSKYTSKENTYTRSIIPVALLLHYPRHTHSHHLSHSSLAQVWFQNARAKWRRNLLKQEHERHVGEKMKEQGGMMTDLRPVESLGPAGLTDLYAMSSGDEGSQSLQFTDMCQ